MKSPLSESTWEQDLFSEKSQPFPSRSTRSSSGIKTMTSRFLQVEPKSIPHVTEEHTKKLMKTRRK
ncbi:hypothetical protein N665_0383s0099 [Sinapis alba]|nr:hypothetical protein N665_0383s0099 [Sinapis alba]